MPAVYLRSEKKEKKTQKVRQSYVILILRKCILFGISPITWTLDEGHRVWKEESVFLMVCLSKTLYPDRVKLNNLTQDNYLDSNKTCKYSKD